MLWASHNSEALRKEGTKQKRTALSSSATAEEQTEHTPTPPFSLLSHHITFSFVEQGVDLHARFRIGTKSCKTGRLYTVSPRKTFLLFPPLLG